MQAWVNENTRSPDSDIKMGDHSVVWINPKYKARNVYIFMGNSSLLFNKDYKPYIQCHFLASGK